MNLNRILQQLMCKSEQLLETCSGSASGSIQWFNAHDEVNLKKIFSIIIFSFTDDVFKYHLYFIFRSFFRNSFMIKAILVNCWKKRQDIYTIQSSWIGWLLCRSVSSWFYSPGGWNDKVGQDMYIEELLLTI